jgi:NAD(P)-dependent dehydrogenase (short-subunit alcohol dehydrogenase family)
MSTSSNTACTGKRALVTGGTTGRGAAIVERLRRGQRVFAVHA